MQLNPNFPTLRSTAMVVAIYLLVLGGVAPHVHKWSLILAAALLLAAIAMDTFGRPKATPEQYRVDG
jgi:hypothetical protein